MSIPATATREQEIAQILDTIGPQWEYCNKAVSQSQDTPGWDTRDGSELPYLYFRLTDCYYKKMQMQMQMQNSAVWKHESDIASDKLVKLTIGDVHTLNCGPIWQVRCIRVEPISDYLDDLHTAYRESQIAPSLEPKQAAQIDAVMAALGPDSDIPRQFVVRYVLDRW